MARNFLWRVDDMKYFIYIKRALFWSKNLLIKDVVPQGIVGSKWCVTRLGLITFVYYDHRMRYLILWLRYNFESWCSHTVSDKNIMYMSEIGLSDCLFLFLLFWLLTSFGLMASLEWWVWSTDWVVFPRDFLYFLINLSSPIPRIIKMCY